MKIVITQRDIDNAISLSITGVSRAESCPIALAANRGAKRVKMDFFHRSRVSEASIAFYNGRDNSIEGYPLPDKASAFVKLFDNSLSVLHDKNQDEIKPKPFSFDLVRKEVAE